MLGFAKFLGHRYLNYLLLLGCRSISIDWLSRGLGVTTSPLVVATSCLVERARISAAAMCRGVFSRRSLTGD